MSTEVENFLAHFGVKGMKWGQTKATRQASGVVGITDLKVPGSPVRTLGRPGATTEGHREVATVTNRTRAAILNQQTGPLRADGPVNALKSKYSLEDLKDPVKRESYHRDVENAIHKEVRKSLPKGLDLAVIIEGDELTLMVGEKSGVSEITSALSARRAEEQATVKHSRVEQVKLKLVRDAAGYIVNVTPTGLAHTIDSLLVHYASTSMTSIEKMEVKDGTG